MDNTLPGQENPAAPIKNIDVTYDADTPLEDIQAKYTQIGSDYNQFVENSYNNVQARQAEHIGNDFGGSPYNYHTYYEPGASGFASAMRQTGTQEAFKVGMERGKAEAEANLEAAKNNYSNAVSAYNSMAEQYNQSKNDALISTFDSSLKPEGVTDEELFNYMTTDTDDPYAAALRLHQASGGGSSVSNWDDEDVRRLANQAVRNSSDELREAYDRAEKAGFGTAEAQAFFDRSDVSYIWTRAYEQEMIRRNQGDSFAQAYADNSEKIYSISQQVLDFKNGKTLDWLSKNLLTEVQLADLSGDEVMDVDLLDLAVIPDSELSSTWKEYIQEHRTERGVPEEYDIRFNYDNNTIDVVEKTIEETEHTGVAGALLQAATTTTGANLGTNKTKKVTGENVVKTLSFDEASELLKNKFGVQDFNPNSWKSGTSAAAQVNNRELAQHAIYEALYGGETNTAAVETVPAFSLNKAIESIFGCSADDLKALQKMQEESPNDYSRLIDSASHAFSLASVFEIADGAKQFHTADGWITPAAGTLVANVPDSVLGADGSIQDEALKKLNELIPTLDDPTVNQEEVMAEIEKQSQEYFKHLMAYFTETSLVNGESSREFHNSVMSTWAGTDPTKATYKGKTHQDYINEWKQAMKKDFNGTVEKYAALKARAYSNSDSYIASQDGQLVARRTKDDEGKDLLGTLDSDAQHQFDDMPVEDALALVNILDASMRRYDSAKSDNIAPTLANGGTNASLRKGMTNFVNNILTDVELFAGAYMGLAYGGAMVLTGYGKELLENAPKSNNRFEQMFNNVEAIANEIPTLNVAGHDTLGELLFGDLEEDDFAYDTRRREMLRANVMAAVDPLAKEVFSSEDLEPLWKDGFMRTITTDIVPILASIGVETLATAGLGAAAGWADDVIADVAPKISAKLQLSAISHGLGGISDDIVREVAESGKTAKVVEQLVDNTDDTISAVMREAAGKADDLAEGVVSKTISSADEIAEAQTRINSIRQAEQIEKLMAGAKTADLGTKLTSLADLRDIISSGADDIVESFSQYAKQMFTKKDFTTALQQQGLKLTRSEVSAAYDAFIKNAAEAGIKATMHSIDDAVIGAATGLAPHVIEASGTTAKDLAMKLIRGHANGNTGLYGKLLADGATPDDIADIIKGFINGSANTATLSGKTWGKAEILRNIATKSNSVRKGLIAKRIASEFVADVARDNLRNYKNPEFDPEGNTVRVSVQDYFSDPANFIFPALMTAAQLGGGALLRRFQSAKLSKEIQQAQRAITATAKNSPDYADKLKHLMQLDDKARKLSEKMLDRSLSYGSMRATFEEADGYIRQEFDELYKDSGFDWNALNDKVDLNNSSTFKSWRFDKLRPDDYIDRGYTASISDAMNVSSKLRRALRMDEGSFTTLGNTLDPVTQRAWQRTIVDSLSEKQMASIMENKRLKTVWDKLAAAHEIQLDAVEKQFPQIKGVRESTAAVFETLDEYAKRQVQRGLMNEDDIVLNYFPTTAYLLGDPTDGVEFANRGLLIGGEKLTEGITAHKGEYVVPVHGKNRKIDIHEILDALDRGEDHLTLRLEDGSTKELKINPQGSDPKYATMAYVNTANNAMFPSRILGDGDNVAKAALQSKNVLISGEKAVKRAVDADNVEVDARLAKLTKKATTEDFSARQARLTSELDKITKQHSAEYTPALNKIVETGNAAAKIRMEMTSGARPDGQLSLKELFDVSDSDAELLAQRAHKRVLKDIKAVANGEELVTNSPEYAKAIQRAAANNGDYQYNTVVLAAGIENNNLMVEKVAAGKGRLKPGTAVVGDDVNLKQEAVDWMDEEVRIGKGVKDTRKNLREIDVSKAAGKKKADFVVDAMFSENAPKTKKGQMQAQYAAVLEEAKTQAISELRADDIAGHGLYDYLDKVNTALPDKDLMDYSVKSNLWSNIVGMQNAEVSYDDMYKDLGSAYVAAKAVDDAAKMAEIEDATRTLIRMQQMQRYSSQGAFSLDADDLSKMEAVSPQVDVYGNQYSVGGAEETAAANIEGSVDDMLARATELRNKAEVRPQIEALAKQFEEGGALYDLRKTSQANMISRNQDIKKIVGDFDDLVRKVTDPKDKENYIKEVHELVKNMDSYSKAYRKANKQIVANDTYNAAAALGIARPGSAVSYNNNPARFQAIATGLKTTKDLPETLAQNIVKTGRRGGSSDAKVILDLMTSKTAGVYDIPTGELSSQVMDLINFDAGTAAGRYQQFVAAANYLLNAAGDKPALASELSKLRQSVLDFGDAWVESPNAYGDIIAGNSGTLLTDFQSYITDIADKSPFLEYSAEDVSNLWDSRKSHGGYRYTVDTPIGKVHFAEVRPELGTDVADLEAQGVKPYATYETSKSGTLENTQTIAIYAYNADGDPINGDMFAYDDDIVNTFRQETSPTDEEATWDILADERNEERNVIGALDRQIDRNTEATRGRPLRGKTEKLALAAPENGEAYANYIVKDSELYPFKAQPGFDEYDWYTKRFERATKKNATAMDELEALDRQFATEIDGKKMSASQIMKDLDDKGVRKYLSKEDYAEYTKLKAQKKAIQEYLNNPKGKVYHALSGATYTGDDSVYTNMVTLANLRKSVGGVDDDSSAFVANADDKKATKAMKKDLKKGRTASNSTLRGNAALEEAGLKNYRTAELNDKSRRLTLDRFTELGTQVRETLGDVEIDNEHIMVDSSYADLMVRYNEKPLSEMGLATRTAAWVSDRAQWIQNFQLAGGVGPYNALSAAQFRSAILENPAKAAEFVKLYASVRNNRSSLEAIKDNIPFLAEAAIQLDDPTLVGDLAHVLSMQPGENDGGVLASYYSKVLNKLDDESYKYPKGFWKNLSQDVSTWFEDPTFLQAMPVMRAQMMCMNYDAALSNIKAQFPSLSADEVKEAATKLAYVQTQKFWHPEQFLRNQFDVDSALERIHDQRLRKFIGDNITGEGEPTTVLSLATNAFFALRYKQTFVNRAFQGFTATPKALQAAVGEFNDVDSYINAASGTRLATSVGSLMGLGVLAAVWCEAMGVPTAWDDFTFEPQGDEIIHIPSALQKIQTIGQIWLPNDRREDGTLYVNPNKRATKLDPMFSMWTLPNTTMRAFNKVLNSQTDDYAAPQRGLPFLGTNNIVNKAVNSNVGRAITDEVIGSNLLSPLKAVHEVLTNSTYYGNNIWERKYLPDGKENPNYDPSRNVTASIFHLLGWDKLLDPNGYNTWVKGGENRVKQDQIGTVSGSGIFQHEYFTAVKKMMDGDYADALVEAGELPFKFQKLSSTARTELNTVVKNTLAHYATDYKEALKNARNNDEKDELYAAYVKKSADAVAQWSAKYDYILGENQDLVAYATRMLMAMTAGEYDDNMAYLQNAYWKATQIAQIESTENLFFKDDDLDAWIAEGGTAEDFYKEKNRRSDAYNQALDDEWEARQALRKAGYSEEQLADYTYEDLRSAQRTASNKVYTEIQGKLSSRKGEFDNFKDMKSYYEELIDNVSTTNQKVKLAQKYNQEFFDVIAPYVDQYGASLLTDTKVNGTGIPQNLAEYVIIPADQKYYGKTPKANYIKDYFGVGYRNKTNLPSDDEVVKKFSRAMEMANSGKTAAASSVLESLVKRINSGDTYASDEDYNRIIRLKALTTRRK